VHALWPRQLVEPVLAQAHATPAVLHTHPGECRVEVVAPIEEHRAGFESVDEFEEAGLGVGVGLDVGPDGGGEAIAGVVHEGDGFFVGRDLLDSNDRAKGFFLDGC